MIWEMFVQPFVGFGFMRHALMDSIAISVGVTLLGVSLILRDMTAAGDSMAHATPPGAVLGCLVDGHSLRSKIIHRPIAGMAVSLIAGIVLRAKALCEDASQVVLYLIPLAVVVLIVSTQGSNVEMMHVRFGTLLVIGAAALTLLRFIASDSVFTVAALFRPPVLECAPTGPALGERDWRDDAFRVSCPDRAEPHGWLPCVWHADGGWYHDASGRSGAILGSRHRRTDRRRPLGRDALDPECPLSLLSVRPASRPAIIPVAGFVYALSLAIGSMANRAWRAFPCRFLET